MDHEGFKAYNTATDFSYLVTYETGTGELTFNYSDLYSAIHMTSSDRVYTMAQAEEVKRDLGTMEGDNAKLTVHGYGYADCACGFCFHAASGCIFN